uniref:Uncharacterized protein n=1 Tax=Arundo donax TaxID=35708 RepID=A0A0A9CDD9_ARUDO
MNKRICIWTEASSVTHQSCIAESPSRTSRKKTILRLQNSSSPLHQSFSTSPSCPKRRCLFALNGRWHQPGWASTPPELRLAHYTHQTSPPPILPPRQQT